MKEAIDKIRYYIEQFCRAKETGRLTFDVDISQGGIGKVRVTISKTV